jgi:hypothetical protein
LDLAEKTEAEPRDRYGAQNIRYQKIFTKSFDVNLVIYIYACCEIGSPKNTTNNDLSEENFVVKKQKIITSIPIGMLKKT